MNVIKRNLKDFTEKEQKLLKEVSMADLISISDATGIKMSELVSGELTNPIELSKLKESNLETEKIVDFCAMYNIEINDDLKELDKEEERERE